MMYVLLTLSIVLSVLKSSLYNNYAKTFKPDMTAVFGFNAISYAMAAIVSLLFGVGDSLSVSTLLSAVFYAVVVCSLQAMSVVAMTKGKMSATSLMVLYGMIIPAIAGPLFWKEKINLIQVAGILLVLVSMWFLRDNDTEDKSIGKKWGIYAVICFLLSGFAGLAEKIHQSTDGRNEKTAFLLVAYIIMFLFSVVVTVVSKKHVKKRESLKPIVINGGISGVIVSFYSLINLTLAGNLDSMVYYPIANGGSLVLTVFISIAVFRENCSKRYVTGFILGFLSVILLSVGG